MSGHGKLGRRQFLKIASGIVGGGIAFPYVIPASALGRAVRPSPSERITMGFIGVGGQGTRNVHAFIPHNDVQVLAVCDVETGSREYAAHLRGTYYGREPARNYVNSQYAKRVSSGTYKGCAAYVDFRELLARDDIDAVVIGAPDHWHVPLCIAAAKAGKDIYCEKPMTLTIAEGRDLCDAVRRYNKVFQAGTQHRSVERIRFLCELVRNGRIGKLNTIRVQIPDNNVGNPIKWDVMPVPDGFQYDMWLGPAPWQPYTQLRCHYAFRFVMDYSGGQLTNFGAHYFDIAQWGNGTQYSGPVKIKGEGEFPGEGLFTTATKVNLEYAYADGVKMYCNSGGNMIRFEGTDGWVEYDWEKNRLSTYPARLKEARINPNEIHLYKSDDHHRDFLESVKIRKDPIANVEIGQRSATVCHLGNIAMKLQRELTWDPQKERFVNDSAANDMLGRSMRAPWHL